MTKWVWAGVALAALGGCAMDGEVSVPKSGGRSMAGHFTAKAMLRTPAGADAGWAVAKESDGKLKVTVHVAGLSAGKHGVHVHTTGKCDAPDFASAGGHWNPTAHQHGMNNPAGPHVGDLPNVLVGANGIGEIQFVLPGTYEGLLDQDGAALVVHAGEDDLKTDPSGNSGGRIACGVFEAV
jgi:Cu-Zn family superoxide dismutase